VVRCILSVIMSAAPFSLLGLLCALSMPLFCAPLSVEKIDQIAIAGQIWSTVHYFHPWMAYKDLPWNSVLVDIVPGLLNCRSDRDCESVVADMLERLGDPATRVVVTRPPERAAYRSGGFISAELLDGDVLLVRSGILKSPSDDAWPKAVSLLGRAKSVLFDVRGQSTTVRPTLLQV